MEDGTLRRLELYLHDLHKKIDGIYDMLMLRHERSGEDKGCSCINERLLDNQDLCLLFQISPRSCNATAVWECFPTSGWDRRPTIRRKT